MRSPAQVSGIDAVVGYAERNADPVGRPLHNAVALLREGKIVSRHFKTLLPTYDVFDESRILSRGRRTSERIWCASAIVSVRAFDLRGSVERRAADPAAALSSESDCRSASCRGADDDQHQRQPVCGGQA